MPAWLAAWLAVLSLVPKGRTETLTTYFFLCLTGTYRNYGVDPLQVQLKSLLGGGPNAIGRIGDF